MISKETLDSMNSSRHQCSKCGRNDLHISQATSTIQEHGAIAILCPTCKLATRISCPHCGETERGESGWGPEFFNCFNVFTGCQSIVDKMNEDQKEDLGNRFLKSDWS